MNICFPAKKPKSTLCYDREKVLRHGIIWILFCIQIVGAANEWNQHLGPNRNGQTSIEITSDWPQKRPQFLWKKKAGEGWSGPVSDGKVAILYHRPSKDESVECFDLFSGNLIWEKKLPTTYRDSFGFDNGPRATPLISNSTLFLVSPNGVVRALDIKNGDLKWVVNTDKKFGADTGFFGLVCSPLIHGEKLILNIGGKRNHGVIALHHETGELIWNTNSDEAGYSSPIIADFGTKSVLAVFNRYGLLGIDPEVGKEIFREKWRSSINASVNAASPVIDGNHIFITSSYNTGAVFFNYNQGTLKKIWDNDDSLSSHYTTPVLINGYLYGIHGRVDFPGDLSFRCVNLKSGKVEWSKKWRSGAAIINAKNLTIAQMDDGELWLFEVSPKKMAIKRRIPVISGETRAHPALVRGIYLVKSDSSFVAVDLRKKTKKRP